jgi:WXG100 family type VII secretion target
MADIKIDNAGLAESEQALKNYMSDLQGLNTRLTSLIDQIGASWEGNRSRRFLQMMLERRQKAEEMVNVLREFSDYAKQARERFTELDKRSAAQIRSSF